MSGFWIIWLLAAVIFQVMFGYVSKVYFTSESSIRNLASMGIDFLGLVKLFGTATMNGTWWYMSAAIIFIICVPLFMKNEDSLILILCMVAAIPHMLELEVMGKSEILLFLGKHSMNIFLIHTFIRQYFWKDYAYSSGHFVINILAVILPSIVISIVLEWLKKVTGYNRLVQNICTKIG